MSFKKSIAILLAVVCAVAAFAMAASADTSVSVGGATYKVISPKTVAITGEGVTPSFRGNGSIEVLNDGDIARTVTNHDNKGIVLIINDEIAARATVPVVQDLDNIPTASIEMDFGSAVSFDTAYMAIYWQQAGIYEPDGNKVIVETSADGKVWVPVGEDGSYYFSIPKCPDWEEGLPNADQGYPYIGEVAIPLGETVKAQYVRYSYTFPVLEEGSHWTFYTNVAEFIGFTEVGVANFESGRKPKMLRAEDVATRPAIEGVWHGETTADNKVPVVTFKDDKGEMEYLVEYYDLSEFVTGNAEVLETVKGNYFIEGNKLVVIVDGGYDEYTVSFDDHGCMTWEDMDGEEFAFVSPDAGPVGGDPSGEETSDDTSEPDASTSDEPSDEPSADTSSAVTSSAGESSAANTNSNTTSGSTSSTGSTSGSTSGASSAADSSNASDTEGGFPGWIIAVIVGGVAVVAAVVVVVIKKKKA